MRFFLYDDYESLSLAAAESLIALIRNRPELVLGAASGESPRRMYQLLGQLARAEPECLQPIACRKARRVVGLRQGPFSDMRDIPFAATCRPVEPSHRHAT